MAPSAIVEIVTDAALDYTVSASFGEKHEVFSKLEDEFRRMADEAFEKYLESDEH